MKKPAEEIRCAIYTRKSTEEGLEQEFNSLDAQRESAEAFIASQRNEGWTCLEDRYDDGGFTGGNMERPALKRLLADIEEGRVDCVVVYKVDRLSRSLLDFARIMEVFESKNISFVSVTQQFNTTHSMGRLTLNILLSFAQFEREIISERTRDKIAAARRRGKWAGGRPVLGYDLVRQPGAAKLVVNEEEADRVRDIFTLYLECESVMQTIRRLDELGWMNKAWTTKKGRPMGGKPFNKSTMFKLLTNVAYLGKVRHHENVYEGEHEAIVDEDLFRRVQALMRHNRGNGGTHVRNKHGALLKGLVRCKACGSGMSHHFATSGNKRYRYYVCVNAQKRGWDQCPAPSLPAGELEEFVVDQIRSLGQDEQLVAEAIRETHARLATNVAKLETERNDLLAAARSTSKQIEALAANHVEGNGMTKRLAELHDRLHDLEQQITHIEDRITRANRRLIDEDELVGALETFDPTWNALTPRERERLVHLIVRQVEYDAEEESISVTLHQTGITLLKPEAVTNE